MRKTASGGQRNANKLQQGKMNSLKQGFVNRQKQGYVNKQKLGYVNKQKQGYVNKVKQFRGRVGNKFVGAQTKPKAGNQSAGLSIRQKTAMQAVKLAQQKLAAATIELNRATTQQKQKANRSMQVSQKRNLQYEQTQRRPLQRRPHTTQQPAVRGWRGKGTGGQQMTVSLPTRVRANDIQIVLKKQGRGKRQGTQGQQQGQGQQRQGQRVGQKKKNLQFSTANQYVNRGNNRKNFQKRKPVSLDERFSATISQKLPHRQVLTNSGQGQRKGQRGMRGRNTGGAARQVFF